MTKRELLAQKKAILKKLVAKLEKRKIDWWGTTSDDVWAERFFPNFLDFVSDKDLEAIRVVAGSDEIPKDMTEDDFQEEYGVALDVVRETIGRSFVRHLAKQVGLKVK